MNSDSLDQQMKRFHDRLPEPRKAAFRDLVAIMVLHRMLHASFGTIAGFVVGLYVCNFY